jgi:hypothetical protein
MERLVTVDSTFEAKLIAARLGSDGVICEIRGGVDGPYPIGPFHICVPVAEFDLARDLLQPCEFSDDDLLDGLAEFTDHEDR